MIRTLLVGFALTPFLLSVPQEAVVVGAKNFTESEVLQELMAQMLEEHAGLKVERQKFGGTKLAFDALQAGAIHVYAEYTGTGLRDILHDEEPIAGAADAYARAQAGFRDRYPIEWGPPFGLNNTYVLVMRRDKAQSLGIRTLSDLVKHPVKYGVSHEFLERPDGIPGIEAHYGVPKDSIKKNASGMTHDLAYQALKAGEIDVMDGYSTDGRLSKKANPDLVLIADDRNFFPPYEAAPLVRSELYARPKVRMALSMLAGRLDDETIRGLNYAVDVGRRDHAEVVSEFLAKEKLSSVEVVRTEGSAALLGFLWARKSTTLVLTGQHLYLTGVAVFLACLLGVPLGIFAGRRPRLSAGVVGVAGVLQTIPSIALLAFMLPLFGTGAEPAIAALFLYGLLPILRNTVTGIRVIDSRLLEVGTGLGMTKSQLLWKVELPLAVPVILAGVRTSAVINIGTATLAAFIGAKGLGDEIVTGLARSDNNLILAGAIPAALLAVAVDALLGLLEKGITPRGLRVKQT